MPITMPSLMEDIYNASGLKNDLKKNYNISLL